MELLPPPSAGLRTPINSERAEEWPGGVVGHAALGLPWGTGPPPPVRLVPALSSRLSRLPPSDLFFMDVTFAGNPTKVDTFYVNSLAMQRSAEPSEAGSPDPSAAHARIVSNRIFGQPKPLVRIV